MLEAINLSKDFYRPKKINILLDVSLKLNKGESISISGASGSGKSTLLQILGTLEEATSGTLKFRGKELSSSKIAEFRQKHCGFVFQSANLLDDYTLIDNVLLKAKIARRDTRKGSLAYKEAMTFLEALSLKDRLDFPVKYLSGGEKQRGAIARAFMNHPDIIMADEPTGNLDQESALITQELLMNTAREFSKSLLLVTHDLEFANKASQRYELKNSKIYPTSKNKI
jgi:lipoprotein-releasing system ATP-binding protein